MHPYIKKLQNKKEATRKQILTGVMIISMTFVVFIWIFNLDSRFNSKVKSQAQNDIKPFQLFANSISSTYKNISASVGSIPNPDKVIKTITTNQKQIGLTVINNPSAQ